MPVFGCVPLSEALLEAIRNDVARLTFHARNLFYVSAAMYDAWAVFDDDDIPYPLGNRIGFFACGFSSIKPPAYTEAVTGWASMQCV